MKVVVTSKSGIKIAAAEAALSAMGINAQVIGVKATSGINEQPIGSTDAEKGAENRINDARSQVPDADWYVSIENGLFHESGKIIDRAVVWVQNAAGKGSIRYSNGVEFPREAFDIAQSEGFATTTVEQVLARDPQKYGVTDHTDPHASLSAHPRQYYLEQALRKAMSDMLVWRDKVSAAPAQASGVSK